MTRTTFCCALLLGVLLSWVRPAAACDLSLRSIGEPTFTGAESYRVFSEAEAGQMVTFQVRHKKDEDPCSYFVAFSRGSSATYDRTMSSGAQVVRYQIYDSPAKSVVLKDVVTAIPGEVLTGTFATPDLETQTLSYYVEIPAQQIVPPATYDDRIVIRLFEGTLASYVQRDWAYVNVKAAAQQEVGVCVGCFSVFDAGLKAQTLDFGTLTTGAVRSTVIRTRSNDGYAVSLTSGNRGVMRSATTTTALPYVLDVDGQPVDLRAKGGTEVVRVRGSTEPNGDALTARVTIGNLNDVHPGVYSDRLTITVTTY